MSSSSSSSSQPQTPLSVDFTTRDCSEETYNRFLEELLQIVQSGRIHLGIPILCSPTGDTIHDHFLINLSNEKREPRITVVGKKGNLYLVAFRSRFGVFFFDDTSDKDMKKIFPKETNIKSTGFPANYIKLEGNSKQRMEFPLGISKMSEAINLLHDYVNQSSPICYAFMVFLQLISESLRLKKYYRKAAGAAEPCYGIYRTFMPSKYDAECQNAWGTLSDSFMRHNSRADKLKDRIFLPGGKEFTQEEVKKGRETQGDDVVDSWDNAHVENMNQVFYILKVIKAPEA